MKVPRLLSVRAVSEATSLPQSTIYDAVARNDLIAVRLGENGRSIRIREDDLLAWIDKRREVRA